MNKKHLVFAGIIIAAAILTGSIYKNRIFNAFYRIPVQQMDEIPDNSRLLVVAPHCDDETLGSAGMIQQVLDKNGKVKVVLVTNGDGSSRSVKLNYGIERPAPEDYIELGQRRQQETILALAALGVSKDDIVFLGYPDGSMDLLWLMNWKSENPLVSRHTRKSSTPYENSYRSYAAYTGENAAEDMTAIMEEFRPTIISYPHPNDQHRDHWAVHAFVKYALLRMNTAAPDELLYLVHWQNWPVPSEDISRLVMNPPVALTGVGTVWKSLVLIDRHFYGKSKAIPLYKTQMKTMGSFLLAFQRENELYGQYPQISVSLNRTSPKPHKIITSPKEVNFNEWPYSPGKIQAILLGKDKDKLRFEIKANKELSPESRYELEVILFKKGKEPYKIVASCEKGKSVIHPMAESKYAEKCRIEAESNLITLSIPKNMVQQGDTALVNGRVYENRKIKNRTAWRAIRFQ